MVIEPGFGTFCSVARCRVLMENEGSVSIKLVSWTKQCSETTWQTTALTLDSMKPSGPTAAEAPQINKTVGTSHTCDNMLPWVMTWHVFWLISDRYLISISDRDTPNDDMLPCVMTYYHVWWHITICDDVCDDMFTCVPSHMFVYLKGQCTLMDMYIA